MKSILKLTLLVISMLFVVESVLAQGCNLTVKAATKELTRTQKSLLSFVADADRMIFDIDAHQHTNTVATLSVFVDGRMVKGVAVKKGKFDAYFALNNLNGKHVEIKGHKASPTNKRKVSIQVKKFISIFNKVYSVATQKAFTTRIPPSDSRSFTSFGACNGKAKLTVSVTNNNLANMVVRVREGSSGGRLLNTFTLGGSTKSFIKYINSDKNLHITFTNTNPAMRKEIRASVKYTNSIPSFSAND